MTMRNIEQVVKTLSQIKTKGKTCNCCGKVHRVIHSEIKVQIEKKYPTLSGIYFDCECKSTLFKQLAS